MLAPHLAMAYAPEPDLFIRTGGEERISNFLLWQLAYSELYFTDTFWPDFSPRVAGRRRSLSYQSRERRFGRTGEQVASKAKTSLMLKTRVITALVLLAVLLPVLYFGNPMAFAVVATVFFGAAIWECVPAVQPGTAQCARRSPPSGPRVFALRLSAAARMQRRRSGPRSAWRCGCCGLRRRCKLGLPPLGTLRQHAAEPGLRLSPSSAASPPSSPCSRTRRCTCCR